MKNCINCKNWFICRFAKEIEELTTRFYDALFFYDGDTKTDIDRSLAYKNELLASTAKYCKYFEKEVK